MVETRIGSVRDNDGDTADVSAFSGVVAMKVTGAGCLSLTPSRARALAAILNSAADVAEGQGR